MIWAVMHGSTYPQAPVAIAALTARTGEQRLQKGYLPNRPAAGWAIAIVNVAGMHDGVQQPAPCISEA